MNSNYLYFDHASTTSCSEAVATILSRFTREEFGNPSSAHSLGQTAARAIHDARRFFADQFGVGPDQVIFTGSGTESDNLAVIGSYTGSAFQSASTAPARNEVLISAVEHPAVGSSALSLRELGADVQTISVNPQGQLGEDELMSKVSARTAVISIMTVNNITGAVFPVSALATASKTRNPDLIFHTDAVQAFGKMDIPKANSSVDLVSISAHKIHGPKGIGALIVLNRDLITKKRIRPLIFGGNQENAFRSGTPHPGLIASFHAAAAAALSNQDGFVRHASGLRRELRNQLLEAGLLKTDPKTSRIFWNSPEDGAPHIVNISAPGLPAGPLQKLMDEQRCLVSTGSACNSVTQDPDPILLAMGFSRDDASSALRISFGPENTTEQVKALVRVLGESVGRMSRLLGRQGRKRV